MVSILIDYKLQRFTREIKYSLGFIFQSLGYGFRFITDVEELKPNDIFLIYGFTEPAEADLKAIAAHCIAFFIQCDPDLYEPKAYNPERISRSLKEIKLLFKIPVIASKPFHHPAENYTETGIHAGKINFDLVGNVFFHLSRKEHDLHPQAQEDAPLPDEASAFFGSREVPIVDSLLWLLDSMIKEHARSKKIPLAQKLYWPQGQEAAVILSHTVDDLQKWDLSSLVLSIADDFTLFFTFKWRQLLHILWGKLQYLFTNYELYWNFEEFRRLERENNFHSTYYLATERSMEIDYSLDDTDLQEELRQILSDGSEVGLLITNDKLNRDDMMTRKQILLHLVNADQIGIRHLGYPYYPKLKELHQKLNPAFSQTTAFKEVPGFYSACSLPFHPYQNGKVDYLELPTLYRDQHLKVTKHKYLSLDDAKQQIKKFFQITLRTHGVFSTDFSMASFCDIHYCQKLYPYILALVKTAPTWVTTARELATWWTKRSKVTIEEDEYEISLYFPEEIEHFGIQVISDRKIKEITGIPAKQDGNLVRFANVKAESIAVIRFVQPS